MYFSGNQWMCGMGGGIKR